MGSRVDTLFNNCYLIGTVVILTLDLNKELSAPAPGGGVGGVCGGGGWGAVSRGCGGTHGGWNRLRKVMAISLQLSLTGKLLSCLFGPVSFIFLNELLRRNLRTPPSGQEAQPSEPDSMISLGVAKKTRKVVVSSIIDLARKNSDRTTEQNDDSC